MLFQIFSRVRILSYCCSMLFSYYFLIKNVFFLYIDVSLEAKYFVVQSVIFITNPFIFTIISTTGWEILSPGNCARD